MATNPQLIDITKLNTAELNALIVRLRKGFVSQSVIGHITRLLKLRVSRNKAIESVTDNERLDVLYSEIDKLYDEIEKAANIMFNIALNDYLEKMRTRISIIGETIETFGVKGESK